MANRAVTPKVMTIEVSASACGSGEVMSSSRQLLATTVKMNATIATKPPRPTPGVLISRR